MGYYHPKKLSTSFEEAVERVTSALKAEGFGVLTEIDVQDTIKKKLDADFRPYRILGACKPPLAHKALQIEQRIGVRLPCNVIVQQTPDGSAVEVAAVEPVASMQAVGNRELSKVAEEVQQKLHRVIDGL